MVGNPDTIQKRASGRHREVRPQCCMVCPELPWPPGDSSTATGYPASWVLYFQPMALRRIAAPAMPM